MTASRTGSASAVRALLAAGADPHAREHAHEQTALMWAAAQGHPEVVRLLLAAGARVDDRSLVYPQVVSSSGNADRSGVFEVMQGGYTPLLFAARRGDAASARLLVAAGADVDAAAASGTSPLVVAAHSGHGALAAFLLSAGADPGAADAGYAALHAAVLRGDAPLVRTLLAHGADPDAVLVRGTPARRVSADWRLPHNMIGATPLWVAARFREPEIVRVLAEYGADPSHEVGGETALMAAIRGSSNRGRFGIAPPDADEEARRTLESVTAALDAGADVDARNGKRRHRPAPRRVAGARRRRRPPRRARRGPRRAERERADPARAGLGRHRGAARRARCNRWRGRGGGHGHGSLGVQTTSIGFNGDPAGAPHLTCTGR